MKEYNRNSELDLLRGTQGSLPSIQELDKFANKWKAYQISINFALLFMAFFGVQNVTSLNEEELGYKNLGYYLLSFIYLFDAIGSFFSSAILKRIGFKKCIIIGSFCHFIFVFVSLLPQVRDDKINKQSKDVSNQFLFE